MLVGVAVLLPAPPAWAGLASGLTQNEQRALDAGELVVREATRSEGSLDLVGGTSYQLIDAKPDVLWKALLDTPRYPRMMPRVLEAKLVSQDDDERTVYLRQGAAGILEKRYYLTLDVDEERRDIAFALDRRRPHNVEAAWGFCSLRPYRDGRVLLTYGVMADMGGGLFGWFLRSSVHEWMLKTPSLIKRFIEGSGRSIYR